MFIRENFWSIINYNSVGLFHFIGASVPECMYKNNESLIETYSCFLLNLFNHNYILVDLLKKGLKLNVLDIYNIHAWCIVWGSSDWPNFMGGGVMYNGLCSEVFKLFRSRGCRVVSFNNSQRKGIGIHEMIFGCITTIIRNIDATIQWLGTLGWICLNHPQTR